MANSVASASAVAIVRVRDAVVRIGIGPLLSLVTGSAVRKSVQPAIPEYELTEGELWRHSVASAFAVEVLAPSCGQSLPPESFAAALLHDIRKLIMAHLLDASYLAQISDAQDREPKSSVDAETEILGMHHGEAGGIVARYWKLPSRIVAGIAYHHEPDAGNDLVCDVVHVANVLAKRVGMGRIAVPRDNLIHPPSLERLGLPAQALKACHTTLADRLATGEARYG